MIHSKINLHTRIGVCIGLLLISVITCACSTNRFLGLNKQSVDDLMPIAWETSHRRAIDEAGESGKIVMLWFTGSYWCKYCTLLEEEVFHTTTFNEWYADKIVPVMIDFPRQTDLPEQLAQQNEELKNQYNELVQSYPTVLFVDTDGNVLGKLGYMKGGPEHWIQQAEGMLGLAW